MPESAESHKILRSELESRHGRVLCLFAAHTLATAVPIFLAVRLCGASLTIPQYWAILCVLFLLSWWCVYFRGDRLRVWTLRRFLVDKSRFRTASSGDREERKEEWNDMKDKAQSTVGTLSILIAVITLFLALLLQADATNAYQEIVRFAAVVSAILTITCMAFAIDILDTVSNVFRMNQYSDSYTDLAYSKYFYRKLGPTRPRGGISYAYYGFALFSIFVVGSVGFFETYYAGIGVAAYVYLGYPFWFGYIGKEGPDDVATEVTDDAGAEVTGDVATEVTDDAGAEVTDDVATEVTDDAGAEVTDDVGAEKKDGARVEFDESDPYPPYVLGGGLLGGTFLAELGPAMYASANSAFTALGWI